MGGNKYDGQGQRDWHPNSCGFARALLLLWGIGFSALIILFYGVCSHPGAASIVPAVGTMIVWVPVCIVQFATGDIGNAIALTLYLIGVGGIDNVLRFSLLKRIGDVHPIITVFGVLLGQFVWGNGAYFWAVVIVLF